MLFSCSGGIIKKKRKGMSMNFIIFLNLIDDPVYEEKFSEIFLNYENLVLNIAYNITKNCHDAEDAAQEAFIGIAKNIKNIQLGDPQKTKLYVCVAAKNASYNLIKKRKSFDIPSEIALFISDSDIDIEENAIKDEDVKELLSALADLPEQFRDALTFHYFSDLSLKEISELLNIPKETVKSNLHRGKQRLRGLLKKEIRDEKRRKD